MKLNVTAWMRGKMVQLPETLCWQTQVWRNWTDQQNSLISPVEQLTPPPPGRVGGEVALVEVGWRGAPAETPPRGEGPGAGPILGGEERDGVSEDGASASGSNRLDSVAGGRRFRGSLCRRPPLCVAPPFRYEVLTAPCDGVRE
jgi:hypothetical protein